MLEKWMSRAQKPLTVLGFVFLFAFALPIMFPNLSESVLHVCTVLEFLVWLAFFVDYVVCVVLAPRKLEFIKSHIFGLVAVALPTLQPLRALRALAVVVFVAKGKNENKRKSLIATTAIVAGATWFFAALLITQSERDAAETTIHSFGEGLWWAITTMATVGYGDTHPVTAGGRIIGSALMIVSVALIGTMTATIASYFTEIFGTDDAHTPAETGELAELTREVQLLREELSKLIDPKS